MNKEKNNKFAISGLDGVKAKCNQFLDSFAALCGGKDKMKICELPEAVCILLFRT